MISDLAATAPKRQWASISAVVTRGKTDEVAFVFSADRAVGPISVGTQGDWRVEAADVAPIHFYLCFDGETLFGVAANSSVTLVAGKLLGPSWTRLPDACELHFGAAVIAVSDARGPRLSDPFAAETIANSIPSFVTRCAERHLEDPFEAVTVMRRPYETRVSRLSAPVVDPLAAETIAEQSPVAPSPATSRCEELSSPRAERARPMPAPSTLSRTPLVRRVMAGLVVAAVVVTAGRALKKFAVSKTAEPVVAVASSKLATKAAPRAQAARVAPPPSAEPLSPLPFVNGQTPERQAVDRVARGAFVDAAVLYERLARRTKDPTFAAAARIARRKAKVPFPQ